MNEEQLDKLNVAKIWFASMVHKGKKPSHHIVEPPSMYYHSPVIAYQHRIVSQEEQERAMAQQQQSVVQKPVINVGSPQEVVVVSRTGYL
jgi:hypothetical protein